MCFLKHELLYLQGDRSLCTVSHYFHGFRYSSHNIAHKTSHHLVYFLAAANATRIYVGLSVTYWQTVWQEGHLRAMTNKRAQTHPHPPSHIHAHLHRQIPKEWSGQRCYTPEKKIIIIRYNKYYDVIQNRRLQWEFARKNFYFSLFTSQCMAAVSCRTFSRIWTFTFRTTIRRKLSRRDVDKAQRKGREVMWRLEYHRGPQAQCYCIKMHFKDVLSFIKRFAK